MAEDASLSARLKAHLDNPAFIKGWEVDKRTCVGNKRANLRKAARNAKARLSGSKNREGWTGAIETLLSELTAACEADFDGMLSEALQALSERPKAETVTVTEEGAMHAALQHLQRGDASSKTKRDYAAAESCATHVRTQAIMFAEAAATLMKARQSYVQAVDNLREELQAIGEADFDGLLRQAINTLKSNDVGESTLKANELAKRAKQTTSTDIVVLSVPTTAEMLHAEAPPASERPTSLQPVTAESVPPPKTAKPAPPSATSTPSTPPPNTTPWPPPPTPEPAPPPPPLSSLEPFTLEAEEVDVGCVWLGTLPPALQAALLRETFAPGAVGVCGGLAEGQRVRGVRGQRYEPVGTTTTGWSGLGLHGCHVIATFDPTKQSAAATVLAAVRAAAPSLPVATRERLEAFAPSGIRVAYETMGGRSIPPGSSLCGWSSDRLRENGRDGSLKLVVLLGTACKVTEGFKYRKADKETLNVTLQPGDLLLLHDDARDWVSAVTGFDGGGEQSEQCPFDFVHLSLLDLHGFERTKPGEYSKLLKPPRPKQGDASYKWMQCGYEVVKAATEEGRPPHIELRGRDA